MTGRSSRVSRTSSSRAPSRKPEFFIQGLAESLLGEDWRERIEAGSFCDRLALEAARPFVAPELLTDGYAQALAEAFGNEDEVPHVRIDDPVRAEIAELIHQGLEAAHFHRHHHAAYRIDIAPLGEEQPPALTAFISWLQSPEAARLHLAWVGHPRWREPCAQTQVQVSRLRVGQSFERHVDTDQDALAVVYNFTPDWNGAWGGVLRYSLENGKSLSVAPRFNSVFLSRPQNAPHEVTEVTSLAAGQSRYTVTAFYVLDAGDAADRISRTGKRRPALRKLSAPSPRGSPRGGPRR